MPLKVSDQLIATTAVTAAPAHGAVFGMPWEVWLIVLAVVLPFLFAIGAAVAAYLWMRGRMQLDRFVKIFTNGDVKIGDMTPHQVAVNMDSEKHALLKGKPKLFLLSRFGWRQPVHFFEQGRSMELDLATGKSPEGNTNEHSEYLKAYVDTERAKQIFTLSLNLGFAVVLAVGAAAIGILIGLAIAHFSGPQAGASAAQTTTTTISAMVKR